MAEKKGVALVAKAKTKELATPRRDPKPAEQVAIAVSKERLKARPARVQMELQKLDGLAAGLEAVHSDQSGAAWQMMDNLGSVSNAWVTRSLMSLINMAAARGKPASSDDINAALAFIAAIDPQNEMEAALAMQMFATHDLSMEMMRSAKHASMVRQLEAYGNLATKMARTFTGQIEALSKLRRGGEQIVRHIHVDNRGGQAVIAETVNTGGAGNGRVDDQPYGQSAILSALPGPDEAGNGMPISCDARPETMSHPRRKVARRASGKQARS